MLLLADRKCISGVDYAVMLVLDKHRQVAVLQANR